MRRAWVAFAILAASLGAGCLQEPEGGSRRPDAHQPAIVSMDVAIVVDASTTEFKLAERVRLETAAAVAALRKARVFVTKQHPGAAPPRFEKEPVTVIAADGSTRPALRVRFRILEAVLVPESLSRRSQVETGVLLRDDPEQRARIIRECTDGGPEATDNTKMLAYAFNPALPRCKEALAAEQSAIDEARKTLPDARTHVPEIELARVYLPLTAIMGKPPEVAAASPAKRDETAPAAGAPGGAVTASANDGPGGPGASVAPRPSTARPPVDPIADRGLDFDFSSLGEPKFLVIWFALLALIPLLWRPRRR